LGVGRAVSLSSGISAGRTDSLPHSRLVTVTGPGGTGKTRLSLQVAGELLADERDGVWLVELAGLSDAARVPQTVAAALGVREAIAAELLGERMPAERLGTRPEARSLMQSLVEYLQAREILLILDNCEHLIAACAELADALLRACPGVRILATSRERLNVAGETTYRLPSLSLPEEPHEESMVNGRWLMADGPSGPHQPSTINHQPLALMQSEAVRLFVDRAVAALPTFALSEQNAPAVAQVCSRLDGIPLAIELAAARVRALPVEKINERLDDRFRLLTGGSRTASPRQQTLRALIDWSYDLLTEQEQALLCRLSVFSGGWTLEAAEAVCGEPEGRRQKAEGSPDGQPLLPSAFCLLPANVLDLLASLVEKSLVQYEEEGGVGRYRLLETVRQYGWERLRETGETAILRERHGEWCVALAEAAEPAMRGPELIPWLERLDAEHDNLRAALEWSMECAPQIGQKLAGTLWVFWMIRGHMSEGRESLERVLECAAADGPTPARARALAGVSALACFQGDAPGAERLCEECLEVAGAVGSKENTAMALMLLTYQHVFDRWDAARSMEVAAEGVAVAREQGEPWLIAICLHSMGLAALWQGDLDRAEAILEESLAIFREIESRWLIGFPLVHLGFLAASCGEWARATAYCRESLARQSRLGDRWGMALSLKVLAEVAVGQGQPARGARLLGASEALYECLGALVSERRPAGYERVVAAVQETLGEAAFAAARAEGRTMKRSQLLAYAAVS
jgi:predicted ATPase